MTETIGFFDDLDEELIFDIELEVTTDAGANYRVQSGPVEDKHSTSTTQFTNLLSALFTTDAFQQQVASDVIIAKASSKAHAATDSCLPALAAALPHYDNCNLFIREAVGASPSSLTACLSQLRHAFLVLEVPNSDCRQVASQELIIDPCFCDSFVIGNPTKQYEAVLGAIPEVYVGTPGNLKMAVSAIAGEIARSCKNQGMPVPPWRTCKALLSKWLPVTVRNHPFSKSDVSLDRPSDQAQTCPIAMQRPQLKLRTSAFMPPSQTAEVLPMHTVHGFSPASSPSHPLPKQGGAVSIWQLPKLRPSAKMDASGKLSFQLQQPVALTPGDARNKALTNEQAGRFRMPSEEGSRRLSAFSQFTNKPNVAFGHLPTYSGGIKSAYQLAPDHRQFFDSVLLPIRKVKLQGR